MKIDLTEVSPVKRTMLVEVDADEVASERERLLRSYASKAKIPGFRPGKVPMSVVRQRFAKEVQEDLRERVVSRFYQQAAREKSLQPLGDPILDEVVDEEGKPFTFKTTFEVLPAIELKGYRGIEVRKPAVNIGEADVDKALESLREQRTSLVAEEGREAVTGDVIVGDLKGDPEGGEPFHREGMMIEVGATDNLPAFTEALLGVKAGDEKSFSVDYPDEYGAKEIAGKSVKYEIAVSEVKRREVPELDDEFAKDLGDFDDLAALKARIREDLQARGEREAQNAIRHQLLDKILLEHPVVLPDALVDDEIRHRLEELVRRMMMQGMDPEKAELDWKEMRKQQEEPARKSVHARLVLDAVARAESIEVSKEEVDARLEQDARSMGESVEKLRAKLSKHAGLEALRNQLVREKSLDLLASVANIQSEE